MDVCMCVGVVVVGCLEINLLCNAKAPSHCSHTHVPAPLGARAAQGQLAAKCFSGSSYRVAVLTPLFSQQIRSAAGADDVLGFIFAI